MAASPLAKKQAADNGVDLSLLVGTGPNGRIIAADVADYLSQGPVKVASQVHFDASSEYAEGTYADVPVTLIRKTIAERLQFSKQTIPHYYLSMDIAVDALMDLRKSVNSSISADDSVISNVSLNDFVLKAAALSCQAVPECNAEWMDDKIRLHKAVHVGVAMDLGSLGHSQGGLIVPVIKNAHSQGISKIAQSVKAYAKRASAREGEDGKLLIAPEEMAGGTFTVSNLGMFGIRQFTAIINPPQSCILAVGTVRKELKFIDSTSGDVSASNVKEVQMMTVTLSCDHRVVDGAVGSKWMQHFKGLIENPLQMLI